MDKQNPRILTNEIIVTFSLSRTVCNSYSPLSVWYDAYVAWDPRAQSTQECGRRPVWTGLPTEGHRQVLRLTVGEGGGEHLAHKSGSHLRVQWLDQSECGCDLLPWHFGISQSLMQILENTWTGWRKGFVESFDMEKDHIEGFLTEDSGRGWSASLVGRSWVCMWLVAL